MRSRCTLSILLVLVALAAQSASGRDRLLVVGSSTVYPFAVRVGEEFVGSTGQPTPEIRGTGTGEGFRLFCTGAGESHPDVVNASRRLTKAEWDLCAANGVTDLVEIKIGYDGIVVANAKRAPFISLSSKQIFLALAETVPLDGELVSNPYKRWIEISLTLPSYPIRVLGPPTSSGTRDAFVQLAMTKGCETFTVLQELKRSDVDAYRKVCGTLRTDGPYVESGEDDALIVDQLDEDRSALGIFGYSFLDRNRDRIKGSAVNGEEPTSSTIGRRTSG